MTMTDRTPEEIAVELSQLVRELVAAGRNDLLLRAIGVSVLEDYRIILVDYGNKEVEMTPVHKAVYLLFLNHPEGIEFKKLCEYRNELLGYYMATAKLMDKQTIAESVDMLVDPLNNSINEKCSRIKSIFLNIMDLYTANYYIISGHTQKHFAGSSKIWYERLKNVKIPRELVIREDKQV